MQPNVGGFLALPKVNPNLLQWSPDEDHITDDEPHNEPDE